MQVLDIQQYNKAVTKSNALIEANYKLSTLEQKIILYLISQIHKDDDDFKMYRLPIQEFSEMLGYRGSPKYTELREITKNLMRKVLEIREGQKLKQLSWVSYVEYDERSGFVSLSFDPRLKPYLLQLKREFTTYRLKNVMELKSSYSIRMYELLKRWQYMKEVEIALDDLRMMVGAADKYHQYHNFKKRVLTPAQQEILEKTDIWFKYQEVRKKRKVMALRFYIKEKSTIDQVVVPIEEKNENNAADQYLKFLAVLQAYDRYITEKQFTKIALLAQKVFGENWLDEMIKTTREILQRGDIREPIAFLTYLLNEKLERVRIGSDHNEVVVNKNVRVVRGEAVPDWLEDYQKKLAESSQTRDTDEEDIEQIRRELEERLKKYKD
ncbi:replication initiation protein [Heyndrickxia faecalis]|uniref:replication initiation protein n=1 Tax=Bacillales TaxID=1385 RepID=UPI000E1524BB|nr:replication initiation protein [Parageobacillus thermoglucosidasius]MED4906493.1 replication initiation protein [Parageobacillus thermoglucosidasius]MED4914922.1 replication initiation protein [Parageobacillus thermoglucosidasius]MED4943742.1 replication initiation protein [Parageobacillus thermoglucosidasius]MED4983756.1 replication initiation protein [Parageobacillus thermoglucosidasius]RDE18715.1 replication initiation protein [Parageobacillus thermoglucosidasius]